MAARSAQRGAHPGAGEGSLDARARELATNLGHHAFAGRKLHAQIDGAQYVREEDALAPLKSGGEIYTQASVRFENVLAANSWTLHGEGEFRFEELERLRDDFPALSLSNELKRRQSIWTARLQAVAL